MSIFVAIVYDELGYRFVLSGFDLLRVFRANHSPEHLQYLLRDFAVFFARFRANHPPEHLHASSVQHPQHPEWRWLLHTRRIPVLAASDVSQRGVPEASSVEATDVSQLGATAAVSSAETVVIRPPCAGTGDPSGLVWAC